MKIRALALERSALLDYDEIEIMEKQMTKKVLRMLKQETPPSRNRHFDMYETPEGKRLFKHFKIYRSLSRDIGRFGSHESVHIRPVNKEDSGEYLLSIRNHRFRCLRTVRVPGEILQYFQTLYSDRLPEVLND